MSDRCWFAVHVRKEDVRAFQKIVLDDSGCEEASKYQRAVYFLDSDAD